TPFVSDYQLNLFEIAWLDDEQIKSFRSDFRIVADYFSQMRKTGTYKGSPDKIHHVKEIMELMTYLTKNARFKGAYEEKKKKGMGIGNMLEWLNDLEERNQQEGMRKGRAEGRLEGRAEGRLESVIDLSLRKYRRGWSVEKAADALEKEPGEIAEIYDAIKACGAGSTPEDILKWMVGNKDMAPSTI
ncbi:MAG: hypothetical protein K6E30_09575, partial [Lachnospiraceae bacterium]|nr:hypothetical protein [Lachnospiraceae bacterium]